MKANYLEEIKKLRIMGNKTSLDISFLLKSKVDPLFSVRR